jgi:hypothetical protein
MIFSHRKVVIHIRRNKNKDMSKNLQRKKEKEYVE